MPTHDGGVMATLVLLPEGASGPGVLLLHELGGLDAHMESVAERLAGLGYVVFAPDLFWRIDPDHPIEMTGTTAREEALDRGAAFDQQEAIRDADAALAVLSELPEVSGRPVGVLGFGLGADVAFGVCSHSEPDGVVCYYGPSIPDRVSEARLVDCPIMLHFAEHDEHIPPERTALVQGAFEDRGDAEVHVFEVTGHAFADPTSEAFEAVAAEEAWGLTVDFLRRTLTV